MVVKSSPVVWWQLDLPYLALFLGMRVNELVMERTRKAGFRGVRESHGYVIQHLIEAGRTITELAKRMEVTQQAASKIVAELIGLGMVEVIPGKDRRAKEIHLSPRGRRCVQLGRQARARIESRLIRAAGRKGYEMAKSTLVACLEELGGTERIPSRRIREPR